MDSKKNLRITNFKKNVFFLNKKKKKKHKGAVGAELFERIELAKSTFNCYFEPK